MSSRIEQYATVAIAVCAVAVSGAFLQEKLTPKRRLGQKTPPTATATELTSSQLALLKSAALSQSEDPRQLMVVEVIDVECPFCARYAATFDSLESILGDSIRVAHLNYPLGFHRFARSGAIAVDCAYRQRRGTQFVRTVYGSHDSIGFWSWDRYAAESGIPDTSAFRSCRLSAATGSRIDSSVAVAKSLDVRGTPAVYVGQWQYDQPPELRQLLQDIRLILKGKKPQ